MKDTSPSSTISLWLDSSIIGMAAKDASEEYFFPKETATFAALIIASHAVGSAYCVAAPNKPALPIPLYGIAEQPSNAGKTAITESFYSGYADRAIKLNKEIRDERESLKKEVAAEMKSGNLHPNKMEQLEFLVEIPIGVSDPTPEGLESSLVNSGGFFIAYSTEQGLSKTLLGGMYSDGNKKDDLILKGFNGEYHSVVRANRDRITFSGRPYGGVFELSQEGTIARIMEGAGTTGISERFLMMLEGDLIGYRQYLDSSVDVGAILVGDVKPTSEMISKVKPKKRQALNQYYVQIGKFADIRKGNPSPDMHGLRKLEFEPDAWVYILAAKQIMENTIRGEKVRNSFLASMRGKIDLQIMKIAATIHCMDWDIQTHGQIGHKINIDTVKTAYNVVDSLFYGIKKIADSNELYGDASEDSFVLDYIQSSRTPLSLDKICHNLKRRTNSPFRFYQKRGEAGLKIKESVARLVADGRVCERKGANPVYSA